jgi:hypothetical protein
VWSSLRGDGLGHGVVVTAPVVAHLHWLAGLAPTRLTGSAGERRVHDALAERLAGLGYRVERQPLRFPRHIYGSLALHFGLAAGLVVLAAWAPRWAALGHLVVLVSFLSEAVARRHLLRRLWPRVDTQNVLGTWPVEGPVRRRIVCVAHVDSAYTGLLFHPPVLRALTRPPPRPLPNKQLLLPVLCVAAAIGVELAGPHPLVLALLAVPMLVVALLNAEIVVRDQVVPGAADNLSGCAAQLVLAEAWAARPVPGVELVMVYSGAEEAGTGGAAHLARTMRARWSVDDTDVLVLDTLSNGELFVLEEGELWPVRVPAELRAAVSAVAAELGLPDPPTFAVPAGATDALPLRVAGYRAVALTCIDRAYGAPRHYHHPTDTAENVDPVQLETSTRLAEALLRRLASR